MFHRGLLQLAASHLGLLLAICGTVNAVPATVESTILILARDAYTASTASSGLQGYGIPFETVLVPQSGITLPSLTTSSTAGKYAGIIVMGSVSYDYGGSWRSAITDAQWDTIHDYQSEFHVRMVRTDDAPGPSSGENLVS
jgi:hypothetical protein